MSFLRCSHDRCEGFPGRGDGSFGTRADYPAGSAPGALAVVDVSGDGQPDLIVADGEAGTVNVLLASCLR